MGHLGFAHEEARFAEDQVFFSGFKNLFHPADALKPGKFKDSGAVLQLCHQPFASAGPDNFEAGEPAGHLQVIRFVLNVADQSNLRFIDVAVGKMFQQVLKREDVEFLAQHIAPQGPYPFQEFDRIVQYGGGGGDSGSLLEITDSMQTTGKGIANWGNFAA